MSKCIISFGNINNYYKYIIISVLFLFLNYMAFGLNYNNAFVDIKLFPVKEGNSDINNEEKRQPYFTRHKYIHFIFCYFFTFLFGILYNYIERHITKRNSIVSKKIQVKPIEPDLSSIKLIHKNDEALYFSTNSFLYLLIFI